MQDIVAIAIIKPVRGHVGGLRTSNCKTGQVATVLQKPLTTRMVPRVWSSRPNLVFGKRENFNPESKIGLKLVGQHIDIKSELSFLRGTKITCLPLYFHCVFLYLIKTYFSSGM